MGTHFLIWEWRNSLSPISHMERHMYLERAPSMTAWDLGAQATNIVDCLFGLAWVNISRWNQQPPTTMHTFLLLYSLYVFKHNLEHQFLDQSGFADYAHHLRHISFLSFHLVFSFDSYLGIVTFIYWCQEQTHCTSTLFERQTFSFEWLFVSSWCLFVWDALVLSLC